MKKIAFVLAAVLIVTGCTGLAQTPAGMAKEAVIRRQEFIDYTLPENQTKLQTQEKSEQTLARHRDYRKFYRDYWQFANQTFREIASEGNWIYSPLSAYLPLSELSYALEDGSAPQADLIRLLRENVPKEYWTELLMKHFQAQGYLTASSIWLSKDYQPNLPFLQKNLTSDIYRIDFAAKDAAQLQMDWVNLWTKGFLKDQVKAEDFKDKVGLFCRLIGTTYIKAAWADDFFSEPAEDVFYGADGREQKVPFLCSRPTKMECCFTDRYQAVRVPLKSGYLLVMLPREGETVDALLQGDALPEAAVSRNWSEKRVILHMPDFTKSSRIELLPVLEKLGYAEIGRPNIGYVNLAGKTKDGREIESFVDRIFQESKIEVKKAGVEAAAYTVVDVCEGAALEPEVPEMVEIFVNRPYLYMIADADGLPSFLGVNRDFAAGRDSGQAPAAKATAGLPPYRYDGTDSYLAAICRYLLADAGDPANGEEVTIPAPVVFYTAESEDEAEVFGNFWLFRYRLEGTTLQLQSGRELPGRFRLKKDGSAYTVTAFDQVSRGRGYEQEIQALCAGKRGVYPSLEAHYQEHDYTGQTDIAYVRQTFMERYVEKNNLTITAYRDHGRESAAVRPVKKLRLKDKLYLDTGQFSYLYGCGTMDFSAGMAVAANQIPMRDRQTNFGDCEGQWGLGNRILVVYDGKKHIFEEVK